MAGNADINSIEGRYICPVCRSSDTIIMERIKIDGMIVEKIYCRHCHYDERTHGKTSIEPPKLWRRLLPGKRVD